MKKYKLFKKHPALSSNVTCNPISGLPHYVYTWERARRLDAGTWSMDTRDLFALYVVPMRLLFTERQSLSIVDYRHKGFIDEIQHHRIKPRYDWHITSTFSLFATNSINKVIVFGKYRLTCAIRNTQHRKESHLIESVKNACIGNNFADIIHCISAQKGPTHSLTRASCRTAHENGGFSPWRGVQISQRHFLVQNCVFTLINVPNAVIHWWHASIGVIGAIYVYHPWVELHTINGVNTHPLRSTAGVLWRTFRVVDPGSGLSITINPLR